MQVRFDADCDDLASGEAVRIFTSEEVYARVRRRQKAEEPRMATAGADATVSEWTPAVEGVLLAPFDEAHDEGAPYDEEEDEGAPYDDEEDS